MDNLEKTEAHITIDRTIRPMCAQKIYEGTIGIAQSCFYYRLEFKPSIHEAREKLKELVRQDPNMNMERLQQCLVLEISHNGNDIPIDYDEFFVFYQLIEEMVQIVENPMIANSIFFDMCEFSTTDVYKVPESAQKILSQEKFGRILAE